MRLVIVSGLSGSGKSVALHELEDIDFYCVDNIPAALLKPFIAHTIRGTDEVYRRTAVGLDARNRPNEINTIPALVGELRRSGIACEVLFLHASDEVLLKRYAETRRKHPLVSAEVSLREAIDTERKLLEPITIAADLVIDTSSMTVHTLRERIRERVAREGEARVSLDVRVVRLQARHSGRCGFRVRRAEPAESVLGSFAAASHRPRCAGHRLSRGLSEACAP